MKFVVISDTHGKHDSLTVPDGDVLLHAGDMSVRGELHELRDFNDWLTKLPHNQKLFIPGNHDFCFEDEEVSREAMDSLQARCLIDDLVEIDGVKIWGAPWQPEFFNWAFNLKRGQPLREKWQMIPDDVDILVTHGPPRGIGDEVYPQCETVGCRELRKRVKEIQPSYHIFGHIHEGYGLYENGRTTFVNAAICDRQHAPRNRPLVFEV